MGGYGTMVVKRGGVRTRALAHRISFALNKGNVEASDCVLHRCDNPQCVNPGHLFLGTQRDNMQDMFAKGRGKLPPGPRNHKPPPPPRGEKHPRAVLTDELVRHIRTSPRGVTALARELGLRVAVVGRARRRETWKHVS